MYQRILDLESENAMAKANEQAAVAHAVIAGRQYTQLQLYLNTKKNDTRTSRRAFNDAPGMLLIGEAEARITSEREKITKANILKWAKAAAKIGAKRLKGFAAKEKARHDAEKRAERDRVAAVERAERNAMKVRRQTKRVAEQAAKVACQKAKKAPPMLLKPSKATKQVSKRKMAATANKENTPETSPKRARTVSPAQPPGNTNLPQQRKIPQPHPGPQWKKVEVNRRAMERHGAEPPTLLQYSTEDGPSIFPGLPPPLVGVRNGFLMDFQN
jgi:hypothetical protein